jgi:uncharacterized DUF497 family protein
MQAFRWDLEKNRRLEVERGVTFDDVVVAIEQDRLLDVLEHQNTERYPGQRIFVVRVRDYVYLVPFVETEAEVFLKTIIPSRKATRRYLGEAGPQ